MMEFIPDPRPRGRAEISLIVACSSIPAQVQSFVDSVAATQPVERIELVLVGWQGAPLRPLATAPFAAVHEVRFPRTTGVNEGRAEGVRRASTPIVVLLEDHARLDGPWVEHLLALYRSGPWSAIGWPVTPGHRDPVSWAGYLAEYALWSPGVAEGEVRDHLPGHNCSYRRDDLLELGPELNSLMRTESLLHWLLLERGRRFHLTTAVTLRHFQFLDLGLLIRTHFWYGWNFGAVRTRVRRLGWLRRLVYAAAIPLKPVVRWRGLLAAQRDRTFLPPRAFRTHAPAITATFLVAAIGESLGYLLGCRDAAARLTWYELAFDRSCPPAPAAASAAAATTAAPAAAISPPSAAADLLSPSIRA